MTETNKGEFVSQFSAESLFRMLDSAPDALVLVDQTGKIRFINAQGEKLFGYAREELMGETVERLIPKHLRERHVAQREAYGKAPSVRAMGSGLELFGMRKDGSEFPVEISLSPIHTEHGTFVSSAIRDVTERKRVEEERKQALAAAALASQRMLSAVESIRGMFALFDADDRLVTCNSEFRQFFARAVQGAMVGKTYRELVDASCSANLFAAPEGNAQALAERWLAYHEDPKGTFELRALEGLTLRVAERQTAERGTVVTLWDITEDVRREDELREARAVAEAASAAKSEFLSSMSHELRTPLNAVLGFAQLLLRDKKTPPTERQREKLDYILKGGEHLLKLIDDVLDLARIEAGKITISLEPVSVSDVLTEVFNTLEPMAARAAMTLSVGTVPQAAERVVADRTRFAQVLINYGSNAIKYGKAGGKVTFVPEVLAKGRLRVSVLDEGEGIPLEKQDKLFQPFQRAGQEFGNIEGTGIGLAICKRLAELMEGSVGFRSVPGEGSAFWIELPIEQGEAVSPLPHLSLREPTLTLAEAGGPNHVVVYVEDNPSNIAFMRELMEEFEAVQLLTAPSAEVGLELARAKKPDVIIMDVNLPGMSGVEAAHKLKEWEETRAIPVIGLSAAALMSERQRQEATIFHRYLTKPIKVDELMAALEQALRP